MNDGDIYIYNNRFLKEKDKYLKKNRYSELKNEKDVIIGVLAVLLCCGIFYAGIKRFQKNNMYITIEAKKIPQTKSENNNVYFYLEKQGIQR